MFDAAIYSQRRARLRAQFPSGILLFLGSPEAPANYLDNTYPFRQDSSYLYYWGLDLPDLAALIDVDEGREVIFGNDFTVDDIVWRGPQPRIGDLAARAGVSGTASLASLGERLADAVRKRRTVHVLPQFRMENALALERLLGVRAQEVNAHASVAFVEAVIAQRAIKSPEEIHEIEAALQTAHDMHVLAMRRARPGMYEREVAGAMTGLVAARGVQLAFPIIFSIHGETLHNHGHANRMEAGRMAVNDSGAESQLHYASDITRTIPIGGKFAGPQRDLYLTVLKAQRAAIAATRPGVPFRDVHLLACRTLASDLRDMGLMKGDVDAAVQAGAHAMFFQCGLGHMMGLDVHDMEGLGEQHVGYDDTFTRSPQFGLKSLRMARPLAPGMVMTIEPGIYVIPHLIDLWKAEKKFAEFIDYAALEKFRGFGGIRVEDDVVVTREGCRVLGPRIPIEIDEVEALASA